MSTIVSLLLAYKYWILIPLSILEGPIVAFVAGTLAAAGLFNIYALCVLFFVRDMGMDTFYYMLGYFGGKTRLAERLLAKAAVGEHLENIRKFWDKNPLRTMFIGKLSYGISASFIVLAGTVRVNFKRFFGYGSIVAVTQYGVLLMLGFFFANALGGRIPNIIQDFQYGLGGVAVIAAAYYFISWRMRKRFIKEEKGIEHEEKA